MGGLLVALVAAIQSARRGSGAARFWLFTLKALAFIALRSGRPDDARELLAHIAALDDQAHLGSEVIATLLASITSGSGG